MHTLLRIPTQVEKKDEINCNAGKRFLMDIPHQDLHTTIVKTSNQIHIKIYFYRNDSPRTCLRFKIVISSRLKA